MCSTIGNGLFSIPACVLHMSVVSQKIQHVIAMFIVNYLRIQPSWEAGTMKKLMVMLGILLACSLPAAVHAQTQQVKGELTFIDGKRVLRVWGTHYEMGYAHGYLLAAEIVDMLEEYMLGKLLDVKNYGRTRNLLNWYTRIPQPYRTEME